MKKKLKNVGKVTAAANVASGTGSIISVHNVCHSVCLAVVAILSVFGIIVSADILMWIQDYNLLFWGMGMVFLGLSLALLFKYRGCISKNMILFNIGLLILGNPFTQLTNFNFVFWIAGGGVAALSVAFFLKNRYFVGGLK